MAKRKLSQDQRESIKDEITKGLKAGTPLAELIKSLSGKYGITTETVRYYSRGSNGASRRTAAKSAGKRSGGSARGTRRTRRIVRRRTARTSRGNGLFRGRASRFLQAVTSLSETELRSAIVAKRLLKAYNGLREREKDLLRQVRKVSRKARRLARKLQRLGRR